MNKEEYIGKQVKTIHNTTGIITGVYSGKYPFVVQIIKEGIPYSSDYSLKQLTLTNVDAHT
jgi:hypothetical protein